MYCRPLISYFLEGKTDPERMNYRSGDYYDKMGCEVLYGEKATKIDSKAKKVILESGSEIPYTDLCVAAGSSPFVPPFAGLEKVGRKFSFMTAGRCPRP